MTNPRPYCGEWGDTVFRDELQAAGDGIPVFLRNVEVADDAEIQRGMLLAASTPEGVYSLAGAGDTGKYFAIARDNFIADSDHQITQAYYHGRFHRDKIITSGGSDTTVLDSLELELRRQNIFLVKLHDYYGHFDKWSL